MAWPMVSQAEDHGFKPWLAFLSVFFFSRYRDRHIPAKQLNGVCEVLKGKLLEEN